VSASAPGSLHDFTVTGIEGEQVDLARYRGKVCLVVNVASK
jgi:glutathione peroxidase-family protein